MPWLICLFLFQKGGQKLSKICMVLVGGAWLFAAISLVVTLCKKITWLTYLYYFSYIKLGVTLIKYVPQVRHYFQVAFFKKYLIVTVKITANIYVTSLFGFRANKTLGFMQCSLLANLKLYYTPSNVVMGYCKTLF